MFDSPQIVQTFVVKSMGVVTYPNCWSRGFFPYTCEEVMCSDALTVIRVDYERIEIVSF